ncbi:MAG: site-specific DNA-methyltransferase [Clostridiales bacterium]|nr:site-specific DNA-methyltransferase [Clostridiales bacterium]
MEEITLFQGDCLERMKELTDGSVDMVLTDLPYGITQNDWDKPLDLTVLWKELNRAAKLNAAFVFFGMQPFLSDLIESNRKSFKYIWIWNKHYCRGFLNAKKQPLRNCEEIAVFYEKQCTYNPEMRQGVMRTKGTSSRQRGNYGDYKAVRTKNDTYYPTTLLDFAGVPVNQLLHPTQKPVPLLEYLIRTYTNEGEIVLDCCMGSGSTGVACVNTGRRFIGMELDDGYFQVAKERIGAARAAKE